jgi:SAM-dependent methyltransferase
MTHGENTLNQDAPSWRAISTDPNARDVHAFLHRLLRRAHQGRISDPQAFLLDFVRDHSVLDIGVVAHTIEHTHDPRWRHQLIKDAAASVVGVDVLEEPVMQLQQRGYDVRVVDATSNVDLGARFERVVIGDVIEHVDDPVALLRFAQRHLKPRGQILCSTPNPTYIGTILQGIREGVVIVNAEHVTWITPSMAAELAGRAGLRLASYSTVGRSNGSAVQKAIRRLFGLLGLLDNILATTTFVYIFEPA